MTAETFFFYFARNNANFCQLVKKRRGRFIYLFIYFLRQKKRIR